MKLIITKVSSPLVSFENYFSHISEIILNIKKNCHVVLLT